MTSALLTRACSSSLTRGMRGQWLLRFAILAVVLFFTGCTPDPPTAHSQWCVSVADRLEAAVGQLRALSASDSGDPEALYYRLETPPDQLLLASVLSCAVGVEPSTTDALNTSYRKVHRWFEKPGSKLSSLVESYDSMALLTRLNASKTRMAWSPLCNVMSLLTTGFPVSRPTDEAACQVAAKTIYSRLNVAPTETLVEAFELCGAGRPGERALVAKFRKLVVDSKQRFETREAFTPAEIDGIEKQRTAIMAMVGRL